MKLLVACDHCQAQYDVTGKSFGQKFNCRCGASITVTNPVMRDARIVRCASCGAARNDGDNCGFCGARFSAVDKGWGGMCPRCYCRLPNDANYCVECGIRIQPQRIEEAATKLPCPRCKVTMVTHKVGEVDVTECGSCAGVWLAVESFDQICRDKEKQSLTMTGMRKARKGRIAFELSQDEQVKYIPCPKCRNLMNRRNFARVSGVIIDTCRDCGVWLDNQELGRIIQFINTGGMDRAHEIEMREREDAARRAAKVALPIGRPVTGEIFSMGNHRRHTVSSDILGLAIEGVVSGVIKSLFR